MRGWGEPCLGLLLMVRSELFRPGMPQSTPPDTCQVSSAYTARTATSVAKAPSCVPMAYATKWPPWRVSVVMIVKVATHTQSRANRPPTCPPGVAALFRTCGQSATLRARFLTTSLLRGKSQRAHDESHHPMSPIEQAACLPLPGFYFWRRRFNWRV